MGGVLRKESREHGHDKKDDTKYNLALLEETLSAWGYTRRLHGHFGSLITPWRLPWSMAGHAAPPPPLRVYWPLRLAIPADSEVQLLGEHGDGNAHELLVTEAAAAGGATATAAVGSAVGARRFAEKGNDSNNSVVFVMQPTVKPGGSVLPIPLLAPAHPATGARRTRHQAAQRQQQEQQEQEPQYQQQCQVVLYDVSSPPQLINSSYSTAHQDPHQPRQQWSQPQQQALAARLASHLVGALLAWTLLANSRCLAAAASSGGSRLADFAAGQLAWYMTAQPAGECCIFCGHVWWLALFAM
jgi:hypothetical protein